MKDRLFSLVPAPQLAALRATARDQARAFAAECRAIAAVVEATPAQDREFVAGEVACVLHLAPVSASARLATALAVTSQPRLLAALDEGALGVGHALALVSEVEHLDPQHAAAVVQDVLGLDVTQPLSLTPSELRAATKRAILVHDPALAKQRHEAAKRSAGVRGRPLPDGMGQVVIDCTAVEMATALASIRGRAGAMTFQDLDLTAGQRDVAAALHALGCDRTSVQAVIECPVERAVDVHALAQAPVWSVDVRIPAAVALGLSDHPALLSGYGPIGADEARALLPAADLVRACVDASSGEVLAVDRPVRARAWVQADGNRTRALRGVLVEMATSGGTIAHTSSDGYVPSQMLGRLVDLRDVTSTFPGDSTPARRTDRDHRLPWPLGPTAAWNLQNLSRRWHRAKHAGWRSRLDDDGTTEWTSPLRGVYERRPKWTPPPPVATDAALPGV